MILIMKLKQVLVLCVCALVASMANAQLNLPTMKVGDKYFYYYKASERESVHGIAQKLGVSPDDIAFYNPSTSEGIEKNTLVFVPVVNNVNAHKTPSSFQVTDRKSVNYTLEGGDNIYSVAKKFNTTPESIISNNIGIAVDKYVAGTKVKVTPNDAMPFYYEKNDYKFYKHVIQKDESFYSIANKYGITQSQLQAINPDVKLKKGRSLIVPKQVKTTAMGNMESIDIKDLEAHYATRINDIYFKLVEENKSKEVKVGIILPFQLQKQDAPRQAYLYTDFLKGFMLAIDSTSNMTTRKFNVKVYDTQNNLNVTDSLLALPEMLDLNLIVSPGEPKQLERICNFGKANNINILNCFATKVDDQQSNSNFIQINTPTPVLIKNMAKWFATRFKECSIIYLQDASSENSDMFESIKSNLDNNGFYTQSLKVDGELSFDVLNRVLNPGSNYVFIPSNGNKSLLKKVVAAIKKAKNERFDCEINFMGYPEYVLHLKDYQSDLMAIDTYIFSRFFNTKGFRTRNVENSYQKWFGGTMLDSYPNMGLFGFDTGSYLIKTLGNGANVDEEAPTYKGIQTGFKFNHEDGWNGLINEAITLVHFTPDSKIESFVVTDK